MDKNQFESLENPPRLTERVTAGFLQDQTPRTLIYGYSTARDTFHLYLAEDGIHLVVYDYHKLQLQHKHENEGIRFSECVPDKRVYPEACDYEFCTMLLQAGMNIPFTAWTDGRKEQAFHGLRQEALVSKYTAEDFQLPRQPFEDLVEKELGEARWDVTKEVEKRLVDLLHSVAQSYLMALVPDLPNTTQSTPQGWLDNLPRAIDQTLNASEGLSGAKPLTDQQKQNLVGQVKAMVQPKLADLMAKVG